jgi:hypothetical protein
VDTLWGKKSSCGVSVFGFLWLKNSCKKSAGYKNTRLLSIHSVHLIRRKKSATQVAAVSAMVPPTPNETKLLTGFPQRLGKGIVVGAVAVNVQREG